MAKVVPSSKWTRVIAVAAMVLTLHVASAARAEDPGPSRPTSTKVEPPPPPGTYRLIRIGPQALVREDDQGRVTMVDESTPPPRPARGIVGLTTIFSVLGTGAFFEIQGDALAIGAGWRTWGQ